MEARPLRRPIRENISPQAIFKMDMQAPPSVIPTTLRLNWLSIWPANKSAEPRAKQAATTVKTGCTLSTERIRLATSTMIARAATLLISDGNLRVAKKMPPVLMLEKRSAREIIQHQSHTAAKLSEQHHQTRPFVTGPAVETLCVDSDIVNSPEENDMQGTKLVPCISYTRLESHTRKERELFDASILWNKCLFDNQSKYTIGLITSGVLLSIKL